MRQCNKCGNSDPKYFYYGSKGWYCRKCVGFKEGTTVNYYLKNKDSKYYLKFSLTERQKIISRKLKDLVRNNKSVLLEAVCGAGKTELTFETIADRIKEDKKVGIAIARRQVVIELGERLSQAFPNLKVTIVCQGYSDDLKGDIIVLTTHQLYRYKNYFDLLIIDEPDAFPYKGNEVLKGIVKNSCKGQFVYLTATPDSELKREVDLGKLEYLYLSKRPTNKKLVVPIVKYLPEKLMVIYVIYLLKFKLKDKHPLIVFVPTIKYGFKVYSFLRLFINCCFINSKVEQKDELIKDFKEGGYEVCISTTVLERGVTIKGVDIIVLKANSFQFDEASLTQMAGRVGRSLERPEGLCLFLSSSKSNNIDNCIESIERANND